MLIKGYSADSLFLCAKRCATVDGGENAKNVTVNICLCVRLSWACGAVHYEYKEEEVHTVCVATIGLGSLFET